MRKNNLAAGLLLIFLGLAFFFRNFNVSVMNTLLLFGGFYFLYSYIVKKEQPHLIFAIILTSTGAILLLRDLGKLRFDISGELFLVALGAIFLYFYFSKGIKGFVFPGFILPAIGLFALLENNMNGDYIWPGFFILLGLAFYLIYFTAFIYKSSWPLIPGTILIVFGLAAFAFVFGIVSIDMLEALTKYQGYIPSVIIVLIGVILLFKGLRK